VPLVFFAQPGHWLGPVTGLGWLGLAQPLWGWAEPSHQYICWAGFSPAQPKNIN